MHGAQSGMHARHSCRRSCMGHRASSNLACAGDRIWYEAVWSESIPTVGCQCSMRVRAPCPAVQCVTGSQVTALTCCIDGGQCVNGPLTTWEMSDLTLSSVTHQA